MRKGGIQQGWAGFVVTERDRPSPSPSWRAMAGDDRLGWATRQALARGSRKGRVDCQGGTVHAGLIADCALEPAGRPLPLQFRIWLFSPLKLSRKRITTFISVSIAVDFHRFLFPHGFDNPIETRTPLVWIPLARVRSQRSLESPPLVECTPSLHAFQLANLSGCRGRQPWSLHRPGGPRLQVSGTRTWLDEYP